MVQHAAARRPGTPIVLDRPLDIAPHLGTDLTVGDLSEVVETLARRLHAAGIRRGERVVVHKRDNADILLITCALARLRAVPVLLSPRLPAGTAAVLTARAGPRFVLTDGATIAAGRLDPAHAGATVLLAADTHAGLTTVGDLAPAAIGAERLDPAAPCVITHTSGTTREPKLVEQSSRGLGTHLALSLPFMTALGIRERYALCVSFTHIRAYAALALALARHMPLALLIDQDVTAVREIFLRFRPGLLETHPNTFVGWEALADDPARPLHTVRFFSSTFDAIHPRTVRILLAASGRRFPLYIQAYGQSESGPVAARMYTRRGAWRADSRCVGHPIPGVGVRVRDGRGPIEVRSRGRALAYVGEQELFDDQLDGGWWRMGDLGHRSRWGCVHLLDREIDHIEGLDSALEIEDTLMSRVPQLREVVLITRGDRGVQPVVCTRTGAPLDRAAWRSAVRDLPPMADPVLYAWEDLPHTATLKVRRVRLRELLDQHLPA